MKIVTKWLFVLLLPLFAAVSVAAKDYMEGAEYLRLAKPQPTSVEDKIEVVELFWYGCPHCYYLEPLINKWLEGKPDDVVFVRLPAIVGPRWELLAKAYFTAELLGAQKQIHEPLFEAIHVKKQKFQDEAAVRDFFVSHGVPEQDFDNTFNSFAVSVKMNNAKMMTKRYAISGVPTLIVNGKFSTTGTLAGSNEGIIEVVNFLVAQERGTGDSTRAAATKP